MNTVLLKGNLTRDPELTYTPKGDAVCQFSLAVNEEWFDKDGVKKQSTTFLDCKTWKGMAEKVSEYRKGAAAVVVGKLRVDSWDDKQSGQKRYKTYVLADTVTSPFGKPKQVEKPAPAPADPTDDCPY